VYSVCIEDRYPPGLCQHRSKRDDVCDDGFHQSRRVNVDKQVSGCVAFVFGRAADGRSVCVRVEGVCPKLYYEIGHDDDDGGDVCGGMQQELEREVRSALAGAAIGVERRAFAHCYGYEYDDDTGGRRVHAYLEASYPSLLSWRRACQLRSDDMLSDVRGKIVDAMAEDATIEAKMHSLRPRVQACEPEARVAYARLQDELHVLRMTTLVGLRRRECALRESNSTRQQQRPTTTHKTGGAAAAAAATEHSWGQSRRAHRVAHESFVDPLTRFLFEAKITPASWVRVSLSHVDVHVTLCDVELHAAPTEFASVERDVDAPYVTMYYDIETLGLDPDVAAVIQASAVFVCDGALDRHLVALGTVDPIPNVTVHECEDEAHLLRTLRALVVRKDPDFVVAYNGINFDNQFLAVRARKAGADEFWYLSRFALRNSTLRELHLQSSGMGDNMIRYFDMPGRATFDWFLKLKRDLTSEPQYSLNHFAKKLCGLQKDDVHHKDIPALHAGTSADRARLGKYCVVDSELLHDLDRARTMVCEILQFSVVFGVLPEWVYFRGQQVRFVSTLLRKARTCESTPLLLNRPVTGYFGEDVATFEGATVNEPKAGFYKQPVATLDWASLYPSIMRTHNLCHSTHVLDPAMFRLDGVVEHRINDGMVVYFVGAAKQRGVIPRILEELYAERKAAKAKSAAFAAQGCAALAKVWDGRQLALKISMNSIYGACGATDTGKYPDLAISATVTMQGRRAMEIKKQILPMRFPGVDVIYGDTDSVMLTFADAHDVQTCMSRASEAAQFVTAHFASLGHALMTLEFEKVYCPYLLEGKKRYTGLKFECARDGSATCKGIDSKGIETERKDTLPFVRDIMRRCIEILMYDKDEHAALKHFEMQMDELVNDKIEFERFVMRKNLSAKVENKADVCVQARVNVLRRSRENGSEASTNEQVEYVIINGPKKEKTTMLAEDPVYARANGLKLNRLWYFEHAIEGAIGRLFGVFDTLPFKRVCDKVRSQLDRERLGVGSLHLLLQLEGDQNSSVQRQEVVGARPPPTNDDNHKQDDLRDHASSSSSSSFKVHVPRPYAPPHKKKKRVVAP